MWTRMSSTAYRYLTIHHGTMGEEYRRRILSRRAISWIFERRFSCIFSFRRFGGDLKDGVAGCDDGLEVEDKIGSSFEDLGFLVGLLRNGSKPTGYVLNKILSCCAKSLCLSLAEQVHGLAVKMGLGSDVYICSPLIDLYGKCGVIGDAHKLFDEMPNRNVVTWNSLVFAYLRAGDPQLAIQIFLDMLKIGVAPTAVSISAALVACTNMEDFELGNQIQGLCLKIGMGTNVVVGTGLIDLHSKWGDLNRCMQLFDEMPDKNLITWTSMVTVFVQNQQPEEAMLWVRQMRSVGLRPNEVTYNTLLSSFDPGCMNLCRQVHCCVFREGFGSFLYVAVTLAVAYSECGCSIEDFHNICSLISQWDQIAWNAVIAGFSRLESGTDALECFCQMRQVGVLVDFFTFLSILKAAGGMSALEEGKEIHALLIKTGNDYDINIQNGLVSMYAKCGQISDSKRIFHSMKERDLITWNSIIGGCANHGHGKEAIELFESMMKSGVRPDRSTYLSILSACSHAGLVEKGLEYFYSMKADLLEPTASDHYAVVIDLFGRAGYVDEAEALIDKMSIKPGLFVYKALLSACRVHGNAEVARRCTKQLLELYPDDPAVYVLLSHMLATGGNWNGASEVRKLMSEKKVQKEPGYSWV